MPQDNSRHSARSRAEWGVGEPFKLGSNPPKINHYQNMQNSYNSMIGDNNVGGSVVDMETGEMRPMTKAEIHTRNEKYRPGPAQHGPYQRPGDMTASQINAEQKRLNFHHPRQNELTQELGIRALLRVDPWEIDGGYPNRALGPIGWGPGRL